jgi:molybdate transport system permease protein
LLTLNPILSPSALQSIGLTLELAWVSTLALVALATPLSWWLSQTQSALKHPLVAVVTLPLVLPPSVLGFYLLLALGPQGPIGVVTQFLGWGSLAFGFWGLVLGSVIYSLPFAVQPMLQAFERMGPRPMEVACTLGASPWDAFWSVAWPLARGGWITAFVLSFAHTLGEFGMVLMIGGNIPGRTNVISTEIYGHVQSLEFKEAHALSLVLLVFSFMTLWMVNRLRHARSGSVI